MIPCQHKDNMQAIQAEFDGQVLRPEGALRLLPGERVRLLIVRTGNAARWDMARLGGRQEQDERLVEAGLDVWADALDREDHQ
jgi:hypothetical protein